MPLSTRSRFPEGAAPGRGLSTVASGMGLRFYRVSGTPPPEVRPRAGWGGRSAFSMWRTNRLRSAHRSRGGGSQGPVATLVEPRGASAPGRPEEDRAMALPRRQLGSGGPAITHVGFGAWAIGGGGYAFGWGSQDDTASISAIHRAIEL